MQELYRLENIVGYRFGCICNNHEHVLGLEVDTEDENRIVFVTFNEQICSHTRNFFWRINAAISILLGKPLCVREVMIDEDEIKELVKVLQSETTGQSE